MIRFSLFGIPVEIQPWFWLTTAMLGGVWHAKTPLAFQYTALFVIAAVISILIHEFGHALTGRRLGGGYARVELWAFGGLAYHEGSRFTRSGRFWTVAAGPGAGFVFFLLIVAILCATLGWASGMFLVAENLFGVSWTNPTPRLIELVESRIQVYWFINHLLWINFWWSLINLLPIPPLDGGRIAELFVKPRPLVHKIAIVSGVGMAIVGLLWMGSFYVAILFGYLAWRNYRELQSWWGR